MSGVAVGGANGAAGLAAMVGAVGVTAGKDRLFRGERLGGLRLGWAYVPPAVADVLNRVRGPFNLNGAAMAAGVAALGEEGWVERSVAHNERWRARVGAALEDMGLRVHPSEGNFVLADFGTAEAAAEADAHLRGRGVIVRAMRSYGLPQCLRITIGDAEGCEAVIEALGERSRSPAAGRDG